VKDDLEGCAGCGSPDEAYTRRQALKLGALSLGGAAVAAILPGRVRAGSIHAGFVPCSPAGNCNTGFPGCAGSGVGLGCFCFTSTNNGAGYCGANDYCVNLATCQTQSDCPRDHFCSPCNGCTGCGGGFGVCIQGCYGRPGTAAKPHTPAKTGQMTAAGIRH
jgi:hypothetical protein